MLRRNLLALVPLAAALLAAPAPATAQELTPITDRDYAIDLYEGSVLGNVRIVGMGGAAAASAEGSAGTLVNPAAAAVRKTTSLGRFAWDFHIDAQKAAFSSDFDNNGLADSDEFATTAASIGIVGQAGSWGLGFSATSLSTRVAESQTPDGTLQPSATIGRITLAHSFASDEHTIGVGLRVGTFSLERRAPGGGSNDLFSISGTGLEVGYVWRPPVQSWRVGAAAALPIRGSDVQTSDCDPLDCEGYILPDHVEVPSRIVAGFAWRRAPSPWNQLVPMRWRDEQALLVAADVVITGSVEDGNGVEAFARKQLQASGHRTVVSLRAGVEYEVIPGWLRLRGGSYWEPGRFDGIGGRLHGTAGVEGRLFAFWLFNRQYRVRLSLTGDAAVRYGSGGISIGFWG